jgi:peptidyl-prolyl cis-trans isomerase SurA
MQFELNSRRDHDDAGADRAKIMTAAESTAMEHDVVRTSEPILRPSALVRILCGTVLCVGLVAAMPPHRAQAQAIVTAVNGDPVTTTDVDEYTKILRLSRQPASRNDALEAVVADRLKYDEARKWGVDASDSDIQLVLARVAAEAKMQPDAFAQAAQRAKIDTETLRAHLRALGAWNAYVRNTNKTLGVSEEEISAALAKQRGLATITDYDLRQVVFVLPVKPTLADIDSRTREAQALRQRFTDCESGLPLARALADVAVKEPLRKASDTLSPTLRKILSETPRGHLTAPERSVSGIEMVAVCNKSDDSDPTTLRERIQKEILADKLQTVAERMYRDLRKTAIVSKN